MRDRRVLLYEKCKDEFLFSALVDYLASRSLYFNHPVNGNMTALTAEGEQVPTTVADVSKELQAQGRISIQFWIHDSIDVRCFLEYVDSELLLHTYKLDGLLEDERKLACAALTGYFRMCAQRGAARALIVDPEGTTEGFDWNAFAKGHPISLPALPALIGIENSARQILGSYVRSSREEEIGGGVILMHLG